MLYEITDPAAVRQLFAGWEDTLLRACLQRVMGKLYAPDPVHPKSAMAAVGDFAFYAGQPCRELVMAKPAAYCIMIPQDARWAALIERCFPGRFHKITRYATKKDTVFSVPHLQKLKSGLPAGYTLHPLDGALYDRCLECQWSADFVSVFASREAYLRDGLGVLALKDGEPVSGASSYTRYRDGIDIQVETRQDERRKSLATACCAALILECLKRGLYPSWDAHNLPSLRLSEKLGYEFSHAYTAYEVEYALP